jgi:hypothetical protein
MKIRYLRGWQVALFASAGILLVCGPSVTTRE